MTLGSNNHSWASIAERDGRLPSTDEAAPEPTREKPLATRRDFLKATGFTVGAAAALAGCSRGPEGILLPALQAREDAVPGRTYHYATVCGGCAAGCGMLAFDRDSRPIKMEGNPDHPVSGRGLCAVGQAQVLELYDSKRLAAPLAGGKAADWASVDAGIRKALNEARRSGGRVRFLTETVISPTERELIGEFLKRFGGKHVEYDPVSASAILDAHRDTHGARVLPRYRFENARVIVSLGADFLGTWISPVEYTAGWKSGRRLDSAGWVFSYHAQLESRLSLTGTKADRRVATPPGALPLAAAHLAQRIAKIKGAPAPFGELPACPVDGAVLDDLAARLTSAPAGETLVVCGVNDLAGQKAVNLANQLLGNYGGTVDVQAPSHQRRGDDKALQDLLDEIRAGKVGALFVRGVNPVFDLPDGAGLAKALAKLPLVVSMAGWMDETATTARYVCPEHHALESWSDAEPVAGVASVRQPALRPLGKTRSLIESLWMWMGAKPRGALETVRDHWKRKMLPRRPGAGSFNTFWNQAVHDGWVLVVAPEISAKFKPGAAVAPAAFSSPSSGEYLLDLYPSVGQGDGRHGHNPWLHELPDPVTKATWDNFACLSESAAAALGVEDGDILRVTAVSDGAFVELPALIQPGQQKRTVAIALGYGRRGTERFSQVGPQWLEARLTVEAGETVGRNAAPLAASRGEYRALRGARVKVEKTGETRDVARTQMYHSLFVPEKLAMKGHERRPLVQETTYEEWKRNPAAGANPHHELPSLWDEHPKTGHRWGLAVDLSACTGCSACVISCQSENNVPVVGKDEIRRGRDMYWMRIDRYFAGSGENVEVAHQPMMCQHCDNAPCETVCPVQATMQGEEGLNQQAYNRCVGTRYCANNCPYKVRRFNWFGYGWDDKLRNLALNPDVVVRSRGVMEKCSMCLQRIHEGKAEAKRRGVPLADGDITPACVQSCPASALVFGDRNDPASRISKMRSDKRHYTVLEEVGTRPTVGYMTLVRNREPARGKGHGKGAHADG